MRTHDALWLSYAALRNVFNRLIGCLYHCLHTSQAYDETKAFPTQTATPQPAAA